MGNLKYHRSEKLIMLEAALVLFSSIRQYMIIDYFSSIRNVSFCLGLFTDIIGDYENKYHGMLIDICPVQAY